MRTMTPYINIVFQIKILDFKKSVLIVNSNKFMTRADILFYDSSFVSINICIPVG